MTASDYLCKGKAILSNCKINQLFFDIMALLYWSYSQKVGLLYFFEDYLIDILIRNY